MLNFSVKKLGVWSTNIYMLSITINFYLRNEVILLVNKNESYQCAKG